MEIDGNFILMENNPSLVSLILPTHSICMEKKVKEGLVKFSIKLMEILMEIMHFPWKKNPDKHGQSSITFWSTVWYGI